jgi:hypothetical protein
VKNKRQTAKTWSQVRERIDQGETGDKKVAAGPHRRRWYRCRGWRNTDRSEHIERSRAAEQAGSVECAAAQGREVERPRRMLATLCLAGIVLVSVVVVVVLLLAG